MSLSKPIVGSASGPGVEHFVGRTHELAVLRASVEGAAAGHGQLVLVAGEPGIGKTRLAEELASHARERDTTVLWGRCHEGDGAPAFWPWVQAIRAHTTARDDEALRAELGAGVADVAALVPEIRGRFPDVPAPDPLPADEARFRSFDSLTTFLRSVAARRTLLLVLDDLHWADTPSLLLLRFLAREMGTARMLVVGTYRDVEVGPAHPLYSTMAELTRERVTRRLALRGFDAAELSHYVEATTGTAPSPALAAAVLRETDGNPFFVGEVVRLVADDALRWLGKASDARPWIPETVREVIGRRLARLSGECNALLEIASVLGRDFVLNHVERLGDLARDRVLAALNEAMTARIIVAVPETLAGYRFVHALVRETLYEALPTIRRSTLHGRAGDMLVAVYGEDAAPHVASIAHHFFEAARAGGDMTKAIAAARRAGDHAAHMLAFEEAARHYERALQALDVEPAGGDDRWTLALLRALGAIQLKVEGPTDQKVATLERAVALAERIGDPAVQAATALEYHIAVSQSHVLETGLEIPALRRALDALGPRESALGARLLAAIVLAHPRRVAGERMAEARAARAMAERVGDVEARQEALLALHTTLFGPAWTDERLEISAQMLALLEEHGSASIAIVGGTHQARLLDFLELGDMPGVDAEIDAMCRLLDRTRWSTLRYFALLWRGMRALHQGRYDDAEQLVAELFTGLERAGHLAFGGSGGTQMFAIRRAQGRLAEIDQAVVGMAGAVFAAEGGVSAALVGLLHLDMDREDEARASFERLAADDFAQIAMGWTFLSTMLIAATLAHRFGDRKRAAILYERLRPHAARNIVSGLGVLCSGSTSTPLGLLATTLERWDDAERHFQDAMAFERKTGGRPFLAGAQRGYGDMLVRRGRPEDLAAARVHLDEALRTFQQLGMPKFAEQVEALRARVPEAASADVPPRHHAYVFRRDGDYWTIVYEDAECRLRDARGLAYLAILLERPGREVHAADLVTAVLGSPDSAQQPSDGLGDAPRRSLGDAGPKIDAVAARSYQQRLGELRDEIAEADANHDLGRSASLREELEALTDQLVEAGSRQGSHGERARQAVTKAIGATLTKLHRDLPALAEHLDATVKRGYFCSYTPDPRRPITWQRSG